MRSDETLHNFEVTDPNTIQKIGRNVVQFARKYLLVFPGVPHDYMSEHFDHAMKLNDPNPDVENYTT